MTWTQIRAAYWRGLRSAKSRGETQTTIAIRGGLVGPRNGRPQQHQISKLIRNRYRGPSVETFVRAVEGLGVSVSAFFAAIEAGDADQIARQIADRPADADDLLNDAARQLRQAVKAVDKARRPRR